MNNINNLPAYARNCEFIVATLSEDNKLWFFGAYHTEKTAVAVALMIDGVVIYNIF